MKNITKLKKTGYLALFIGVILLLLGIELGTLIFILGLGFVLYNPNIVMEQKKAQERAKLEFYQLTLDLQEMKRNPDNEEKLDSIINKIKALDKYSFEPDTYKFILDFLKEKPLNKKVRDCVLDFCEKASKNTGYYKIRLFNSIDLYNCSLEILEESPGQTSLKAFCLEVGRWHYSKHRPGGKVTIYDEQAIQNDISVRS